MADYCAQADVYRWIPPGSIPNPARLISDVATGTEIMTLDGHGFIDDLELIFRADAGGTLPSPLVAGTTYYAIVVTDSTFQVSASAGGAAVNLTTAGTNVLVISELPWADWITRASARMDDTMPSHSVPLDAPYPEIVVHYTAGLVAQMAMHYSGQDSAGVQAALDRAYKDLDRWRKGATIRGTVVPSEANLAISSGVTSTDPRSWIPSAGNGYIP